MSIKKDILWRVAVVYIAVFVLGLIILARAVYLQFGEGSKWREKAQKLTLKDITIESNRGDIYAQDMRLLASSIPYYEIRMDLKTPSLTNKVFYSNIDSLCIGLSRLFGDKSKDNYKSQLIAARKRGERYYLIRRKVNYNELKVLKQLPIFRRGRYKGGFIYLQENVRFQPHVNLASRTIGYTTKSQTGNVVGIEGAYDHELCGVNGVRLMQRLSGGVWMPVSDDNQIEPRDGKDVVTTLDVNLQDVAENALLKQLKKHEAHHGSAVLMEVQTGDIKAIANLERDSKGNYHESYNYAVGESTEPGSTFKLPSLMVALEDGYIDLDDTIDTGNGSVTFYDKTIYDSEHGGFGKISVQRVFEVSSNVGVSKIITKYYTGHESHFIDRLYAMNLNDKLGLRIKGEGRPDIKYPTDKLWSGISLPMMSHGYEVRLTPLQLLTFYNAVANDGKEVKPRFVKELLYHGEVVKEFPVQVINPSICSMSTIRKAQKMLEGVVERGTARNLRNENYKIAGKTGTAQIANEKYGYHSDSRISYQASFVGYFPADHPKYSCIVVINSPSNDVYYGNLVAGPVFKEIADKVYATSLDIHPRLVEQDDTANIDAPYTKIGYKPELNYCLNQLGIPYNDKETRKSRWVVTSQHGSYINYLDYSYKRNLVPNVKEMGAKDAVYLLENLGLEVIIKGRGKVASQSILPGTRVVPGSKIILEMSFS